jgi:hypothetical protein
MWDLNREAASYTFLPGLSRKIYNVEVTSTMAGKKLLLDVL